MPPQSDQSKWEKSFSLGVDGYFHQGLFLHQRGQIHEAKAIYRRILSENPAYAGAWQYLGVIAIGQKEYAEAIAYLERSLQLDSSISEWHNNYGVALREIGRTEEAIREFRTALQKRPDYADAWSNYGYALFVSEGTSRKAYAAIRQALKYAPNHSDAWMHLAKMKIHDKQCVEARTILEKLRGMCSTSSFLFVEKMTHIIAKSESNEAAVRYLTPLMDMFPSHRQELYRYLGCLHGEIGNITAAKKLFRETCVLRHKNEIWRWKHLAYCPTVFEDEDQIRRYWETLHRELDEAIAEQARYDRRSLAYEGFCPSFNLPHLGFCCREVKEKFDRLFADSFPEPTLPRHSKKRIRVGFLVTPEHEGGFQRLVWGILKKLDCRRFEPFLFYHEMTASRFHGHLNDVQIVTFNWNFIQSVQKIRETQCDVIYYWKAGEDVWNQFFAMARLAPIQCTSWGTHGTSGIHNMDYYISWEMAESINAQEHYTEKLVLISTNPNDEPYQRVPSPVSRSELSLPKRGAIYFCPHRLPKYHPCFDIYLREILTRDSTGHIVLLTAQPSPTVELLKERMQREMGAELSRRLIFLPSQSVSDYHRYLSAATVVLHAPLYSGEITWVDSLCYGVPSVSQTGELLIQRYGTAYSRLFEVPHLAAKDRAAYIDEAVQLGTNADYRDEISRRILCRRADFFDTFQTTRAWENFLEEAVNSKNSTR